MTPGWTIRMTPAKTCPSGHDSLLHDSTNMHFTMRFCMSTCLPLWKFLGRDHLWKISSPDVIQMRKTCWREQRIRDQYCFFPDSTCALLKFLMLVVWGTLLNRLCSPAFWVGSNHHIQTMFFHLVPSWLVAIYFEHKMGHVESASKHLF